MVEFVGVATLGLAASFAQSAGDRMINVFQPSLGATEIAAVGRVFKRAWLGEGDETAAFVVEFAAHLGVAPEHLVPVSCATEGLFQILALLPAGKVLMPAIHFVGAGNAVL